MSADRPELPGLRILGTLGRGGMGEVMLAEDVALGRRVAVKWLDIPGPEAEPEARRRFEREGRTLASLDHPHLVTVHRLGEVDGRLFLVLELVEGGSLTDRLREGGPLPVAEALEVTRQALGGLAAAWEKGIVHRDVKPSNLLFDPGGRVKVADFGLALPADEGARVTRTGFVVGTPHYMSPEQIRGEELDPRSDLYSLGTVLFEMLAGRPPYEGRSQGSVLAAQLTEPLPDLWELRPELPEEVVRLVERLTAKEPAKRPASAAEALAVLEGPPTAALKVPLPPPEPGRRRRRRPLAAAAVLLGVLGAVALFLVLRGGEAPPVANADPSAAGAAAGSAPNPEPPAATAPGRSREPFVPLDLPPGAPGADMARALAGRAVGEARLEWSGGADSVRARVSVPGRPLLLHLAEDGGLRLLHPAPGAVAEVVAPGEPVWLPAPSGAAGRGGGPPEGWLILVTTTEAIVPPVLLGARPRGGQVVYPARLEGATGTVHPAHAFLEWLAATLGAGSGGWELAVRELGPPGETRRNETDERRP